MRLSRRQPGTTCADDIPCSTPVAHYLVHILCLRGQCCLHRTDVHRRVGAPGRPPYTESRRPARQIVRRRRHDGRRRGRYCGRRIHRTIMVHLHSAIDLKDIPTLLIAALISWNTWSSTGREKSTPLTSAPNVGCSSVTVIWWKVGESQRPGILIKMCKFCHTE